MPKYKSNSKDQTKRDWSGYEASYITIDSIAEIADAKRRIYGTIKEPIEGVMIDDQDVDRGLSETPAAAGQRACDGEA